MDCKCARTSTSNAQRSISNAQPRAPLRLNGGRSALGAGRFDCYENRTSFPGSISKSKTKESSVFGLITSSLNFT
jgi:hypothetical protein